MCLNGCFTEHFGSMFMHLRQPQPFNKMLCSKIIPDRASIKAESISADIKTRSNEAVGFLISCHILPVKSKVFIFSRRAVKVKNKIIESNT